MPPSQLKRLKASLREQGIVGPQKSKKQKKQNAQNGAEKEKRVHRTEALNTIRDQFNPFEYKWSKGPKFGATTIANSGGTNGNVVGRPYEQKSRAEEQVWWHLFHIRHINLTDTLLGSKWSLTRQKESEQNWWHAGQAIR